MTRIIVERTFDTPPSDAELEAVAQRQQNCMDIYGVTWKRSILSEDRRRGFCEYEALDAESVRRVQFESEATFDRVWVAHVIE
jgi:hypothetical protein